MEQNSPKQRLSRRCLLLLGGVTAASTLASPSLALFAAEEPGLPKEASPVNESEAVPPAPILASLKSGHPRLIASAETWQTIRTRQASDPLLDAVLRKSEAEARAIVLAPPVVYKKDGKRLLHVSRVALRRITLLALHYHLTGDMAFAKRAEAEMRVVAAFTDWNPSHFLDTAEMTAALAFGYDWLFSVLTPDGRTTIATAIAEKGLKPGLAADGFWRTENNWNSVCLCGMSLGALAIGDSEPSLAAQILEKTKANNSSGMKPYAPDGVYPEGAMYWAYGTTFQAVLLAALDSALGTDWGLSESPGFRKSAEALYQQLAPSGSYFNFSDGVERPGAEPATFWFAKMLNRPELLRYEREQYGRNAASTRPPQPDSESDRLLALSVVWWPDARATTQQKLALNWYGDGPNPLAVFRSEWDNPKAMYLALKGGKASNSHGHMDAGSFVFEANGVRWSRDLGMQDYLSLESKGIDLWNGKQDGGRWTVFRLNQMSHGTLTINGARHQVDGDARITHYGGGKEAGAIVDLSPVFAGQASRVTRGFAFRSNHVLVRDELEGLKAGDTVRWAMVTRADVALPPVGGSDMPEVTLREDGKELRVRLQASVPAKWEVVPAEPPANGYDAPNPGMRLLVANFVAPQSGRMDWSVLLLSQAAGTEVRTDTLAQTSLSRWPFAAVK